MPTVTFTQNIQRHVNCPTTDVRGRTVAQILDSVFADNPDARGYVLDEQGALRRHMCIFIDGRMIADRQQLSDPVPEAAEVYILQALSGG